MNSLSNLTDKPRGKAEQEPPGFEYRFLEDPTPRSCRSSAGMPARPKPHPAETARPDEKIQIGPLDI